MQPTALWNAIAKHPLSQTCKLLRLEFDSIHQHRVISRRVDCYWLDLENFDLDRMGDLANVIRHLPGLLTHLRDEFTLRVHLYIGKGALESVETLLDRTSTLNRVSRGHEELRNVLRYVHFPLGELEIVFRTNAMSPAQKRVGITHDEFKLLRSDVDAVVEQLWKRDSVLRVSSCPDWRLLCRLPESLKEAQCDFYAKQRRAREQKALDKHGEELEAKLRPKLKSELKSELRQALAEQPETSKWDAVYKFLDED